MDPERRTETRQLGGDGIQRHPASHETGERLGARALEHAREAEQLRHAADRNERLGRRDAARREPAAFAAGEDERVHQRRSGGRSASRAIRCVATPAVGASRSGDASQQVASPSAAAGRMSASKLSPTIQAASGAGTERAERVQEQPGIGLAPSHDERVRDHREERSEAELGEAAVEVAGEVGDDAEAIARREPLEHSAVARRRGHRFAVEAVGDGVEAIARPSGTSSRSSSVWADDHGAKPHRAHRGIGLEPAVRFAKEHLEGREAEARRRAWV